MLKKISSIIFLLLFAHNLSVCQSSAPSNSARLALAIDSILNAQVQGDKIPGADIQIKKDNKVIYKHAYGYAQKYDYDHHQLVTPEVMTSDHLFDIASLTKVIGTTTSIMLLVDRGKIKIDDPIHKYIPTFTGPEKNKITIRHLLTHTAGLLEWYPLYYRASHKMACYKVIDDLPLKYAVGSGRRYSDLGFVLLGRIVENISKLPLEVFMNQNIFLPLGMKNTMYNPLADHTPRSIAATSPGNPYEKRMVYDSTLGYQFNEINPTAWNGWRTYVLKGEVNDGNAWYANGGISGAAGLFSTIDDLQRLVDVLLAKGKAGNKQFISAKTIQLFLTKDKFKNGLGWMMDTESAIMKHGPAGTFGHTGFTGTSIVVMPQFNTSIILLINRQNTGLLPTREYYNVTPVRQAVFNAVLSYCRE
jgi:CubicO group peptidase (beta-lactamase class C family)